MERKHQITAQTQYYKVFLPAVLMVIGLSLFSCQKKEEKKQEVKNIEVSGDTLTTKSVVSKETSAPKEESDQKSIPVKKANTTTSVKSKEEKNDISNSEKASSLISEKADSKKNESKATTSAVETNSQVNAEFPGGIDQFYTFFSKEFKKPENVNYWKLNFKLAFAVEKNGSMTFLECSPAVEEPLEKEIIRVLSLCPKWQAGELNRKKIKMQYSLPISLHNTQ